MAARNVRITRRLAIGALGLLVPAALVGCSSDEVSTDDCKIFEATSPGRTEVTVTAKNMQYDERCLQVEAGELVIEFVNDDKGVAHNLRIKSGIDEATPLESGKRTDVLTVQLDEAGTYDFVCDPHAQMNGKIVVVDPDAPTTT